MADGKHCPKCQSAIGYWAVFFAELPNRIWCPHCKTRFANHGIVGLSVLVVLLILGLTIFAVMQMVSIHPAKVVYRLVIFCTIIFGI